MKTIILCAGYATRLYPLTIDRPKALLPIKGKPILDYTVEKIKKDLPEVDEIIVVSNSKFYKAFNKWREKYGEFVSIIDDKTDSNETRLGGIGDLWLAMQNKRIDDDFLVILGDNLFDFSLREIMDFFNKHKKTSIGIFNLGYDEIKKMGCVEINEGKIISFEEKPENPKSSFCSTGIYFFAKEDIEKIGEYMKTDLPKDGPGFLILDLHKKQDIHAFPFEGKWFDIGSKETYEHVQKEYG